MKQIIIIAAIVMSMAMAGCLAVNNTDEEDVLSVDSYEDCWSKDGSYHICDNEAGTRKYISDAIEEDALGQYEIVGVAHTSGNYVLVYVTLPDDSNEYAIYDPTIDTLLPIGEGYHHRLTPITIVDYEVVHRYDG